MNEPTVRCAIQEVLVLIVDDHPIFRDGLDARISKQPDMRVCGEAEDVNQALQLVEETKPDVVVVDISLKNSSGLDLIKKLKAENQSARVLVSSMHDESVYAERVMRAGARGYVNKQDSGRQIIEAIRQVHSGELYFSEQVANRMMQRAVRNGSQSASPTESLSDRELEVYRLIGEGLSMRAISERLSLKVKTVETYRDRIRTKLDLKNSAELTRHATCWYLHERNTN